MEKLSDEQYESLPDWVGKQWRDLQTLDEVGETFIAGWHVETAAALIQELARALTPQSSCGHPGAAMSTNDEGQYCAWCEDMQWADTDYIDEVKMELAEVLIKQVSLCERLNVAKGLAEALENLSAMSSGEGFAIADADRALAAWKEADE